MTDNEMRGIVLKYFYENRRRPFIQINPEEVSQLMSKDDVFSICQQLGEHGLIDFKSMPMMGRIMAGAGKITASGVDVIESDGKGSPLRIEIPVTQNITVSNSQGVQIGNNNVQAIVSSFEQLIEKINKSNGSEKDKTEAKSKMKEFLEHPLTSAVLGGAVSGLTGLLSK